MGDQKVRVSQAAAQGMKTLTLRPEPGCMVWGNVEYAKRNGKTLNLQILRPAFPDKTVPEKLPLVAFVPGSGWRKQNVYRSIPNLSRFALRGFVVGIIEYRESDLAPFPAQMQDCKTAVRFLRANAGQYGIDINNVALWGGSSGGHTVLFSGITGDSSFDTPDYSEYSCKVNSIVNFYGPADLTRMADYDSTEKHASPDGAVGYLLGRLSAPENLLWAKTASPVNYIFPEKECPPVLTFHGNCDMTVPFEQSIVLHEALLKAGKHSEFYKIDGAGHGSGEFWSNELLDIVEEFIRRYNIK